MNRRFTLLLTTIFLTGVAYAHGDEQHIMGTVTKITDKTIAVEVQQKQGDAQKKTVTVNVVSSTKFEKMGAAATVKDLKVGDRVVIHAVKKGEQLEAHIVKIGIDMNGTKHE